jgi:hypothetical protein
MPFTIRPHRRFPVLCSVTYHAGLSEGQGTVWNLSLNGWRLSGNLPLRVGQTVPLTLTFGNQQSMFVAAAIVRWKLGQDYGLETLVMKKQTQERLEHYVEQLAQKTNNVHVQTQ